MKSIKMKLIIYCGIIILLSNLAIGLFGFTSSTRGMANIQSQMLIDKLEGDIESSGHYFTRFYGDITEANEVLYDSNGNSLEGRYEAVDAILEDLGDVATIFVKVGDDFQSISSNVIIDGERAVGTFLGTDSPAYNVVMNGETYIGEADILGENFYTAYKPLDDAGGKTIGLIFVGVSKKISDEFIRSYSWSLRRNNLGMILVILIISLSSIFLMGRGLANPIVNVSRQVERIANYDLRIGERDSLETLTKRQDEIGIIANSVWTLRENLSNIIENIFNTSHHLAKSSEDLFTISEQSSMASEEVATAIEQIATGALEQAENTENAATSSYEIVKLIEKNEGNIFNLNTSTVNIDKHKEEGFHILAELVKRTELNEKASEKIFEIIRETNENADKIQNASGMIQSISDQTNLLALNAAIESARAGEAGRGFSVVADEIRKLAEQSNRFTEEINTIITELKDRTEEAVENITSIETIISSQKQEVMNTRERFRLIAFAIKDIEENIENLNLTEGEIRDKSHDLEYIISSLSEIAEENAASTEESSASIEEQTASMEEIASSSEKLSELAMELEKLVNRFQI